MKIIKSRKYRKTFRRLAAAALAGMLIATSFTVTAFAGEPEVPEGTVTEETAAAETAGEEILTEESGTEEVGTEEAEVSGETEAMEEEAEVSGETEVMEEDSAGEEIVSETRSDAAAILGAQTYVELPGWGGRTVPDDTGGYLKFHLEGDPETRYTTLTEGLQHVTNGSTLCCFAPGTQPGSCYTYHKDGGETNINIDMTGSVRELTLDFGGHGWRMYSTEVPEPGPGTLNAVLRVNMADDAVLTIKNAHIYNYVQSEMALDFIQVTGNGKVVLENVEYALMMNQDDVSSNGFLVYPSDRNRYHLNVEARNCVFVGSPEGRPFSPSLDLVTFSGKYLYADCRIVGTVVPVSTSYVVDAAFVDSTIKNWDYDSGDYWMECLVNASNTEFRGTVRFLGCRAETGQILMSPPRPEEMDPDYKYSDHIIFGPGTYCFGYNPGEPCDSPYNEFEGYLPNAEGYANRWSDYDLWRGNYVQTVSYTGEKEVTVTKARGSESGIVKLRDALNYMQPGDTVELLRDGEYAVEAGSEGVFFAKEAVLDLNGHTVSTTGGEDAQILTVGRGITAAIKDSSGEKTGMLEGSGEQNSLIRVLSGGTLLAEGICLQSGSAKNCISVDNGAVSCSDVIFRDIEGTGINAEKAQVFCKGVKFTGEGTGSCILAKNAQVSCENSDFRGNRTAVEAVSRAESCSVELASCSVATHSGIFIGDGVDAGVRNKCVFTEDCAQCFNSSHVAARVMVGGDVYFYRNISKAGAPETGFYAIRDSYALREMKDQAGKTCWVTRCINGPYEILDKYGEILSYATRLDEAYGLLPRLGTLRLQKSMSPAEDPSLMKQWILDENDVFTMDLNGNRLLFQSDDPRTAEGFIVFHGINRCIFEDSTGTGKGTLAYEVTGQDSCETTLFNVADLGWMYDTDENVILLRGITIEYANAEAVTAKKHITSVVGRLEQNSGHYRATGQLSFNQVKFKNFTEIESYRGSALTDYFYQFKTAYMQPVFENVEVLARNREPEGKTIKLRTTIVSADFRQTKLADFGPSYENFDLSGNTCTIFNGSFQEGEYQILKNVFSSDVVPEYTWFHDTGHTISTPITSRDVQVLLNGSETPGIYVNADRIHAVMLLVGDGDVVRLLSDIHPYGTIWLQIPMNHYRVDFYGHSPILQKGEYYLAQSPVTISDSCITAEIMDTGATKGTLKVDDDISLIHVTGENVEVYLRDLHVKNGAQPSQYLVETYNHAKIYLENLVTECYGLVKVVHYSSTPKEPCVYLRGEEGKITTFAKDGLNHQGLFSSALDPGMIEVDSGVFDEDFTGDTRLSGYCFPAHFGLVETRDAWGRKIHVVRQTEDFSMDEILRAADEAALRAAEEAARWAAEEEARRKAEEEARKQAEQQQTPSSGSPVLESSGGGAAGGGGKSGGRKPAATLGSPSPNWYTAENGAWKIKNNAGTVVTNAWLCDNVNTAGDNRIWYLLKEDGTMLEAGLVMDLSGNFYSLETNHNGYFGMLRYQNGTYNCNGHSVYLEFSQAHDGSFGAIINPEGLALLKQIYGVTTYNIGNGNSVYTADFCIEK